MNKEYLNQDINNPKYLFHGSPIKSNIIKPHQSNDSNGSEINIDNAIFLFPSFIKSTAYAFKDRIKSNSKGLDWSFNIPNTNDFPVMKMKNVKAYNNLIGYVYVFEYGENMLRDENSYQYKCYEDLVPIDVVEVCYKDYSCYYEINNENL